MCTHRLFHSLLSPPIYLFSVYVGLLYIFTALCPLGLVHKDKKPHPSAVHMGCFGRAGLWINTKVGGSLRLAFHAPCVAD